MRKFFFNVIDIIILSTFLIFSIFSILNNNNDNLFNVNIFYVNQEKIPYYILLRITDNYNLDAKNSFYSLEIINQNTGETIKTEEFKCNKICEKKIIFKKNIYLGNYIVYVNKIDKNKITTKTVNFSITNVLKSNFDIKLNDVYLLNKGFLNLYGTIIRSPNSPKEFHFKLIPKDASDNIKSFKVYCYNITCNFNKIIKRDIVLGNYTIFIATKKGAIKKDVKVIYDYNRTISIKNKIKRKEKVLKNKKAIDNNQIKESNKSLALNNLTIRNYNKEFHYDKQKLLERIIQVKEIKRIKPKKINLYNEIFLSGKNSKIYNETFKKFNSNLTLNKNMPLLNAISSPSDELITIKEIYLDGEIKIKKLRKEDLINYTPPRYVSSILLSNPKNNLLERKKEIRIETEINNLNLNALNLNNVSLDNLEIIFKTKNIKLKDYLRNKEIKPNLIKIKERNKTEIVAIGLISVNTEKPLYRVNETAHFILVVLDKYGYLYSNATINLYITMPNNQIVFLSTKNGSLLETSRGIYEGFLKVNEIGEYKIFAQTKVNNMIIDIESYFNVLKDYPFDILRDVPPTIDPWSGPFLNNFTIIPYNYSGKYDFYEYIPINFTLYSTNSDLVKNSSNYIILVWKNLSGITNPYYVANSPLKSPVLYELGKAKIVYKNKIFYENRSWLFAIDPAANSCDFSSPCYCGSFCNEGHEPGDGTIDSCTDGNTLYEYVNNIWVTDLNGSYFGTGDTVEICVEFNCDTNYGGDRAFIAYKDAGTSWSNSDIIFSTGGTYSSTACLGVGSIYCVNQVLNNYIGTHHIRGGVAWYGASNTICFGNFYRDHDDLNFTVLQRRPAYFLQWNLTNGTFIGDNLNVIRGNNLTAFAKWDKPIQSAIATHNGTGSYNSYNFETYGSNWTNYTIDTFNLSEFSNLGPVKINITSFDLYFNFSNTTSPLRTFYIYGSMKINQSSILPYIMYNGSETNISCQVTDEKVGVPYENVNVNFYNNVSGFIGSALTNSTGWARISYVENNIGTYKIICNVSDDLSNYLVAGQNNYKEQILTVKKNNTDITPPTINSVNVNPSIFSVGGVTNIKANVTDDIKLVSVFLNVTLPNGSSYSYSMLNIGGDIYEYNFSNTVEDGIYYFYIYAYDNSSNKGWSSTYSFTVTGIRTFIGIMTTKKVYKLGEQLNLTSFTRTSIINATTIKEEGDPGYYFYSFNSGFEGWQAQGSYIDWQNGVPSANYINQCDSGNCMSTNLAGNYQPSVDESLVSPTYNFSGRTNVKVTYWRMVDVEDGYNDDKVFFEGSDGTNWYTYYQNSYIGGGAISYRLPAGFSTYYCPELDNKDTAYFRYRLYGDGDSNVFNGWAVDSINISFNPRKDWNKSWYYYNSSFGSDVSKVTAIRIKINVTSYSSIGSVNNQNAQPDLKIQLYNGTSYSGNYKCNLDSSKTYPFICEIVIKSIPEFLISWKNSSNRKIRLRAINLDHNDYIIWYNVLREYVTPSVIENHGTSKVTSYLIEQFLNSSGSVVKTMYNNSIDINASEAKELSVYWNYTVPLDFKLGNYSAYVCLADSNGNVLRNEDDNTLIEDNYLFYIKSLIMNIINPLNDSIQKESFYANLTLNTTYYNSGGWCAYNLDNSSSNITMSSASATNYYDLLIAIPDGPHKIKFYCNDSDNYVISSYWIDFNISENPRINFIAPTDLNNSYVNRSWTFVNVSINDSSNTSSFINFNNTLLGYWNFENVSGTTVKDLSTYSNDGTLMNGASINSTDNIRGHYLNLDGNDDYVDLGSSFKYNLLNNFTIVSWVKKGSTSGWQKFFSVGVPGNQGYSFGFSSNTIVLTKYGILDFDAGYTLLDNKWHQLVGIFNSSGMFVYVDSNLIASNNNNHNLNPITTNNLAYIGRELSGSYFKGSIDEVLLFNRVLSLQEIKALYNSKVNKLYHNFTMLKNNHYNYYACAIDSIGNLNCTENRIININKTLPSLNITSPLNNYKFLTNESVDIDCLASENLSNVKKVWIIFNNNGTKYYLNNVSEFNWSRTFINLSTGGYNITCYGEDFVGNLFNSSPIYFIVLPDKDLKTTKRILSLGNNNYKINLEVKNLGKWKNYQVFDFVQQRFNFYNFSLIPTSNNTINGGYNGTLLVWNLTLNYLEEKNITYLINSTKNYNLVDNYIIG